MSKFLLLVGSMLLFGAPFVCVGMEQKQSQDFSHDPKSEEVFRLSQAKLKSKILAKFSDSIPYDYDWNDTLIGISCSFRFDEKTQACFCTKSYWVNHKRTKKVDWFHSEEKKTEGKKTK